MKTISRILVCSLILVAAFSMAAIHPVLAQGTVPPAPTSAPVVVSPSASTGPSAWDQVWGLLQAAGLPGLLIGVLVLVFVFIGDFTNVFPSGTYKRIAVYLASILFAGVQPGQELQAVTAAIAIASSTLLKLLLDALIALAKAQQAARAKPQ